MPVEMFPDGLEPSDPDAVIWRFMDLWKFERLLNDGALYFRRADLFLDQYEGLLPESRPLFDLREIQDWNHDNASNAQFREAFFVNCWQLFTIETARMWEDYAKEGVAVTSRYNLLKVALRACPDRAFLGLVRYDSYENAGRNILRLISTKRRQYSDEQEVRALLWLTQHVGGGMNRHFDENNYPHPLPLTRPPSSVPDGVPENVELGALITGVVVSPWAAETTLFDVERRLREKGLTMPVLRSDLTRFKALLPERLRT
jgi:hypothetical protein